MTEISVMFKGDKIVIYGDDFDISVIVCNRVAEVFVRSQDKEAVVGAFRFLLNQPHVRSSAFKPGLATASIWFPPDSYNNLSIRMPVPSPFEVQGLRDEGHGLAVKLFKTLKPDLAAIYFPEPTPPRTI